MPVLYKLIIAIQRLKVKEGFESVNSFQFVAVVVQGFGDALDVFFVVGFTGDFEDYCFEAVGHFGLVVVEFDDVGVFFGEDAGDVEELAGFIRQEYAEAEDAPTGYFGFFDKCRNRGNVDIAAADDGGYFFALEGELGEGGKGLALS